MNGSGPARVTANRAVLSGLLLTAATGFGPAVVLAMLCHFCAGPGLGLYLGGLAVVGLIVPPLVVGQDSIARAAIVTGSVLLAVAAVWLGPVFQTSVAITDWFRGCAVLLGFAAGLTGIASILKRVTKSAVVASALAVILGIAWLSWPVWLSAGLTGEGRERVVASLVYAHPLFAMNGAMKAAFPVPWAQYRLAYVLTNIGDDIPYELPASVIPSALLHTLIGGGLILGAVKRHRRKDPVGL